MPISFSALEAAVHFAALVERVHEAEHKALERAARVVEAEAKAEIGDYQPAKGLFAAWAQLADSTKADRAAHGFTPNDPLLRTGKLRDGIEHTVEMGALGAGVAHVGSNSPVAVYQELGTSRIPPRSFLGGAAFAKEHEVRAILGDAVIATIAGKRAI